MMFKLVNTTSNIKDMKEPFDLEHTMVHIKNYGSNQGIKIMEQIMTYLEKETYIENIFIKAIKKEIDCNIYVYDEKFHNTTLISGIFNIGYSGAGPSDLAKSISFLTKTDGTEILKILNDKTINKQGSITLELKRV